MSERKEKELGHCCGRRAGGAEGIEASAKSSGSPELSPLNLYSFSSSFSPSKHLPGTYNSDNNMKGGSEAGVCAQVYLCGGGKEGEGEKTNILLSENPVTNTQRGSGQEVKQWQASL